MANRQKQLGFYIETDRCVGCYACETACKQWNDLEPKVVGKKGTKWLWLIVKESGTFPDVKLTTISMRCAHCEKPACEAVCPVGAISKRPEDGIVVVDQKKCTGCGSCYAACPFGVPQFGANKKMQKCDFCLSRIKQGLKPACELTCQGKAIHSGTMEELASLAARKPTRQLPWATKPSLLISGR